MYEKFRKESPFSLLLHKYSKVESWCP